MLRCVRHMESLSDRGDSVALIPGDIVPTARVDYSVQQAWLRLGWVERVDARPPTPTQSLVTPTAQRAESITPPPTEDGIDIPDAESSDGSEQSIEKSLYPYVCDVCEDKSFATEHGLSIHMGRTHGAGA